jgi:hypothetical protein
VVQRSSPGQGRVGEDIYLVTIGSTFGVESIQGCIETKERHFGDRTIVIVRPSSHKLAYVDLTDIWLVCEEPSQIGRALHEHDT